MKPWEGQANWFELYRDDPEYQFELLSIAVAEAIVARMEALGINRKELARRMGVSQARITQLLAGDENLTLKTLAGVAHALGGTVELMIAEHKKPGQRESEDAGWRTPQRRDSLTA